jgi:hypothetical protein
MGLGWDVWLAGVEDRWVETAANGRRHADENMRER